MRKLKHGEITKSVETFLEHSEGNPTQTYGRERSWDFCFNYFQSSLTPSRNLELSCLQLGYYLASWGMLRGSSYLFRKTNARHYADAVDVIERYNPEMRALAPQHYPEPDTQKLILRAYSDLRTALLPDGGSSRTLVTKVMMGTWGVLPSFDYYLVKGFRSLADTKSDNAAFRTVGTRSLTLLGEFYAEHKREIDTLSERFTTLDFQGELSDRCLPKAKVIDMFGFQRGFSS